MRTYIFFFLSALTLMTSFSATGQTTEIKKTEQEIRSLLCQEWILTHVESKGQRIAVPPEMGAGNVIFNSDGSLIEIEEGKRYKGKWTYDHKTMALYTDDKDGKEKVIIVQITTEALILKDQFQDLIIMKSVK